VNVYSTNDWILGVTFRARYTPVHSSSMQATSAVCAVSVTDKMYTLTQPVHTRFGRHPGRTCPWSRKRKCSWHPTCSLTSTTLSLTTPVLLESLLDEQVDVTELVVGHSSYLSLLEKILDHLELNTYYPVFHPCTK